MANGMHIVMYMDKRGSCSSVTLICVPNYHCLSTAGTQDSRIKCLLLCFMYSLSTHGVYNCIQVEG